MPPPDPLVDGGRRVYRAVVTGDEYLARDTNVETHSRRRRDGEP